MAGSRNKQLKRAVMVVMSFAITLITITVFYQLTQIKSLQAQTPSIRLDRSILSVNENVGTATLNVILENPPSYLVTVTVKTVSSGSATAGLDYVAFTDVLTFTVGGATTQQIGVDITNDTLVEDTESFLVQLSDPKTVSVTLGSPLVASVNINDNDSGSPTATPIFGDQYEPNNTFNEAPETAADADDLCNLTFYPPGDQDYFRWWGKAGITYIVSTSELDAGLDTVLNVYNANQSLISRAPLFGKG